ncbi:MAG: 2-amino-4-hydroxy-6-hydroxymethyldihydropteridine diphosphokinase [Prevotella sp.]|nr:2-amino-4-hydroxy-6-hydroxymethyldihydropteridine diphosphokinase [Prevotella sp.]
MSTVYLGLGSNLGERRHLIANAIQHIEEQIGHVVRQSALYETEPWGFSSPNKFLNSVICVETTLTPRQVLQATQQIERQLGRTRKTSHLYSLDSGSSYPNYSDRPIDIDILLFDDLRVDEPDLQIPHPLMYERDFVMCPLQEILQDDKVLKKKQINLVYR